MSAFIDKLFSRNAMIAGFMGIALPWLAEVYLPSLIVNGGWVAAGATVAILAVNALRAAVEEKS